MYFKSDECRDMVSKEPVANKTMIVKPRVLECEVVQCRWVSLDVLYGAQLCVHQFRTIGGRKTPMEVGQRHTADENHSVNLTVNKPGLTFLAVKVM